MKNSLSKRLLSLLLAVAMTVGAAMPSFAAGPAASGQQTAKVSFEKVDNDEVSAVPAEREALPEEDEAPLYEDTDLVRVSIVLEDKSTIEAVSSKGYTLKDIAANQTAMNYRAGLQAEQEAVAAAISGKALDGEKLDVVWNLTLAANIISANVPYGKIDAIREVEGVANVILEKRYEPAVYSQGAADPNMSTSSAQIGSSAAWASGYTGAGSRIAVIDTGIDTDHQSFAASGYEYSLSHQAGLAGKTVEEYKADLNLLDADEIAGVLDQLNITTVKGFKGTASDLYISSKIPFGYNYVDKGLDVTHDNDTQGEHGSHVEGIAAANAYIPNADGTFSNALDTVKVQGVAPDAQLIVMKVFGKAGGAYDSDYMAAIEDAIVLGADSINLSLGSSDPGPSKEADGYAYQDILDSLTEHGAVVAMAGSNSGGWADSAYTVAPGYLYGDDVSFDTVGSPGSYTNSLAVASVDNAGTTGNFVTVDGNAVFYTETSGYNNQPLTTVAGEQEYIYIDGMGTAADWAAVGDALAGKVALCSRGEISFYEKGDNAAAAGAIATIIYNNQPGVINMDLSDYKHSQPCVSITQADGAVIKAASTPVTDDEGNVLYYTGKMSITDAVGSVINETDYYTMSDFSSWGVPGSLELKPEITAPGGNIYSVNGAAAGGTSYENMSGTSMASPQVAGMAAVVAQYVRENDLVAKTGLSARQLTQSLLMSTAVPVIEDWGEDGSGYYSVLKQGAGLANVGNAVSANTYILMDGSATASAADGKVKAELGDDPLKKGVYNVKFTVNNLTDKAQTYDLSADLFTQGLFPYYVNEDGDVDDYLDTWTTPLQATASWTVDGASVTPIGDSLDNMDFDGNGVVNSDDATAILEYVTGVRTELNDQENADLDGDGDIDNYDAYLFLVRVSTVPVTVPANGKVEVAVTLALTEAQKEELNDAYPTGAYVEGYLYVTPYATADGELGVEHSIPVLGFYGDWSEPSMFDKGTHLDYTYGSEVRTPYLGNPDANTFAVTYDGDSSAYYFGGNPWEGLVHDETYHPERNAINSKDKLSKVSFTSIRNAAASRFVAVNETTGNVLKESLPGEVGSAFYYVNGGSWQQTGWTLSPNVSLTSASEGDKLNFALSLATEHSVDAEGNVDWDALGSGATLSISAVVDNTAPEIEDVLLSVVNNQLIVSAKDNEYISAVVLYNGAGSKVLAAAGSKEEIAAGESADYVLDLAKANGSKFLVQVYDYAMNVTTYQLKVQLGEEEPLPNFISFDLDENAWVTYEKTSKYTDVAVYQTSDKTFTAATIVDHIVFAATDDGVLYTMPETDLSDLTLVAKLPADTVLTDMAYNKADGKLYANAAGTLVEVDKLTGEITEIGEFSVLTNTLACDSNGTFYFNKYGSGQIYSFTLNDGEISEPVLVTTVTGINSQYIQSLAVDPNTGLLYWNSYYAISFFGMTVGYSYFVEIDPAAGTFTKYNDLYDELACLLIPEKTSGGDWSTPTDEISGVQITDSEIDVLVGNSAALTAIVQPWTASNRDVTWTSADEAIATVNSKGVVTGVAEGTTTITAASVLDPTKSATCTVNVKTVDITITAALQDENGSPVLTEWNLAEDETWRTYASLQTNIANATLNWDTNIDGTNYIYQQNTDGMMFVADPATGETVATSDAASAFGAPVSDTDISYYHSEEAGLPVMFGVYSSMLLSNTELDGTPLQPTDNKFTSGWNLASSLQNYTPGATKFVAIAWGGVDTSEEPYSDMFFALTDNGYMWVFFYDGTSTISFNFFPTDLKLDYPDYDGNQYNSLLMGDDGNLYLSHFTGETNELYQLTLVNTTTGFTSQKIGDFGDGVWPAALLSVAPNEDADEGGSVGAVTRIAGISAANAVGTAAAGSLDVAAAVTASDNYTISHAAHISNEGKPADEAALAELIDRLEQEAAAKAAEAEKADEEEEIISDEPIDEEETVEVEPEEPVADETPVAEPEQPVEDEAPVAEPEQPVEDEAPVAEPEEPVEDEEPVDGGESAVYNGLAGSLNSLIGGSAARVRPLSSTTTDAEGVIYLNVTAKDASGADVASNSGKMIVTYDADKYELKSVEMYPAFTSYNDSKAGEVVLAYADLNEIPAGSPVAKLTLVQKAEGGQINVENVQVDADASGYVENFHDHSAVRVEGAVEATCTEDGYTGDVYCVVGGELLEQGEVIPALGHDYVGVVDSTPDCDKPGSITYTCSRCGDSYTEALYAQIVEMDTVLEGGSYILAVKGPYGYVAMGDAIREKGGINPVKVNVTEDGYLAVADPDTVLWTATPSEDGTGLLFTHGDTALGVAGSGAAFKDAAHVWTVSEGKDAHTFRLGSTGEGSNMRYISYYQDYREVPPIDDLFVFRPNLTGNINKSTYYGEIMIFSLATDEAVHETEVRGAKEPTCTEDGYTGDTYCVKCDKLIAKGEVIPALGHDTELVGAKEATCTEAGYTGDQVCKVCGEIVVKGEVIPALGHKTEVVGAKEATCEQEGYTGDKVCTVCGELVEKGQVIPKLPHEYEDTVVAPTTTSKGYTIHTCKNCGYSYVDSYVDAIVEAPAAPSSAPASPKTGDTSNIALWSMLLLASVAGGAAVFFNRKKWFAEKE